MQNMMLQRSTGMLEMKISKLKDVIANSKMIDGSQLTLLKFLFCTTVSLKNNATKARAKFYVSSR